jgi:hypothetical protein
MTVTIALPPDEEKKLVERAVASGQDVSEYVHQLIKKHIEQPTLGELLAPVHQAVRASGMAEHEVDSLIQTAVDDSRRQRPPKPAP